MTRTFCDRCEAETTDLQSGHVAGESDVDNDGNANDKSTETSVDLCVKCYTEWLAWLTLPKATKDARVAHALKTEL